MTVQQFSCGVPSDGSKRKKTIFSFGPNSNISQQVELINLFHYLGHGLMPSSRGIDLETQKKNDDVKLEIWQLRNVETQKKSKTQKSGKIDKLGFLET